MIKKHPQINHVEETENVKWCVFKVPQYIYISDTTWLPFFHGVSHDVHYFFLMDRS